MTSRQDRTLERHKNKRRLRRERRAPRLKVFDEDGGRTLVIGGSLWPGSRTWIHATTDGRLILSRGTRANVVAAAPVTDASVSGDYDDAALLQLSWSVGQSTIRTSRLGTTDLHTARAFCRGAGVRFEVQSTAERADQLGFNPAAPAVFWAFLAVVVALPSVFVYYMWPPVGWHRARPSDEVSFSNRRLDGSFRATGGALGQWTVSPSRCLSGRELGFVGVVFRFGADSPVEELRLDTTRPGDNAIQVRLAGPPPNVQRIAERECEAVGGDIHEHNIVVNGRPLARLVGKIHLSCPARGFAGDADFDGCLPE